MGAGADENTPSCPDLLLASPEASRVAVQSRLLALRGSSKVHRAHSGFESALRLTPTVFEYLPDSPFGLYGAIPLLLAHHADRTIGVFW